MNKLSLISQALTILIKEMDILKIDILEDEREIKGDFIQDSLFKIKTNTNINKFELQMLLSDIELKDYCNIKTVINHNEILFQGMQPINHNIEKTNIKYTIAI